MLYGNFEKAKKMDMSTEARWLIENHPKEARSYCNGVGSTATFLDRLLYHLTPNTIWGLSIIAASQVHDIEYSYPTIFRNTEEAAEFKRLADLRFYANMISLIWSGPEFLRDARLRRAKIYYEAVMHFGHTAFNKGKKILE
jgi:hypothetical protein